MAKSNSRAKNRYDKLIGLDPGVNTGWAVWNGEQLLNVTSYDYFDLFRKIATFEHKNVKFIVEDARQRRWFGHNSDAKKQGAGAVKTLTGQIERTLIKLGIDHEMIHPMRGATKLDADPFQKRTGYMLRTNEHGRDAGMIVFERKMY